MNLFQELTFSVGRMPTNQGPGTHEYDGLQRQGTYPRIAYNMILDGYAATYNMHKFVPQGHNLSARLVYTPLMSYNTQGIEQQLEYYDEKC